jgi:PPOX class probable F420-dependent enzyme
MGQLTMTREEREAFLAGVHIGVLAVDGNGGAPLVAPIWYSYEPGGDVVISTDTTSSKSELLRRAGKATLCVQTESAPYQYVVVEGAVTLADGVDPAWRRNLARKYLGDELGDMYYESTKDHETTSVTVRLTPERWRTTDYNKQFA